MRQSRKQRADKAKLDALLLDSLDFKEINRRTQTWAKNDKHIANCHAKIAEIRRSMELRKNWYRCRIAREMTKEEGRKFRLRWMKRLQLKTAKRGMEAARRVQSTFSTHP